LNGHPAPRDATLDLLRSWSITSVILFHVLHGIMRFAPQEDIPCLISHLPVWLNFSWQPLGVDVIFVVSAYLLTLHLLQELRDAGRINLRSYYIRRVSRIIPLYYLAIILFALAQDNSIGDVVLAFLFIEFLITGSAIVPVGWSMELMMIVYLALPGVAWGIFHARRPFLWLSIIITLSIAIRVIPLWGDPEVATTLFTHLLDRDGVMPQANALYFAPWFRVTPFLIGAGIAALVVLQPAFCAALGRTASRRSALYAGGASLMIFSIFLPVHDANSFIYAVTGPVFWTAYWTVNIGLFSIATALIMLASRGQSLRIAGPWALISRNIMGIYLFHMPMIVIGAVVVFRTNDTTVLGTASVWHVLGIFVIALLLSLGLAVLLNRFIEGPTQRALRRRFNV
jgi:peptidoglycan/LPS O-acetylase OafA/YrhL